MEKDHLLYAIALSPQAVNYEYLICPSEPAFLHSAHRVACRYAVLGNQLRGFFALDEPIFDPWDYRFGIGALIHLSGARPFLIAACGQVVNLHETYSPCWCDAPILDYCNLIYAVAFATEPNLCKDLSYALKNKLYDESVPCDPMDRLEKDDCEMKKLPELWTEFSQLDLGKGYLEVRESFGELPSYCFSELLASIHSEIVQAKRIYDSEKSDCAPELPPLPDSYQRVFDYIRQNPGKTGKEIASALEAQLGTLSRHVFPLLRDYGLKNRPGFGYYIEDALDSAEPR